MTIQDLLLTPIYLMFIYAILFILRSRIYDTTLRKYFIPAFTVKLVGAISLGLIYQFYYGRGIPGGDTFNFFRDTKAIWDAFTEAPYTAFQIIFATVGDYSPDLYKYTSRIYFFSAGDERTFNVIRFSGFFSFFSFNTYSVIAAFFALLSFSGMWAMYKAFYHMFPHLHRPLAYACFFIPSVFFWGSGLLKDSLTLGALGWVFYGYYFGVIRFKNIIMNVIIILVAMNLIREIKPFILIWFIPPSGFWVLLQYRNRIKSRLIRYFLLPFMIVISLPMTYWGVLQISQDNEQFKIENIIQTANATSVYLNSYIQSGSAYSIGELDGSIGGTLRIAPTAIWLGLFRPHPWEFRGSPVMALSALESFMFLFLTFRILFTTKFAKLIDVFNNNPVLIFCLVFSLMVAFSVAITSGNFGSMVRYRIPMMPFYLSMLYIIRYHLNKSTKLL